MLPPLPAKVLDVACGNGRHSIALAARGYDVTGVDLAAPFLDLARGAAAAAGVSVEFRQTDMRDLGLSGFDAALVLGTRSATAPTRRTSAPSRRSPEPSAGADGKTTIELESTFEPIRGINTIVHRWAGLDGEPRRRSSRQRLYTPLHARASPSGSVVGGATQAPSA